MCCTELAEVSVLKFWRNAEKRIFRGCHKQIIESTDNKLMTHSK